MPDGKWQRVWTIRLKDNPAISATIEAFSSEITKDIVEYLSGSDSRLQSLRDDLAISLQLAGPREINAALTTKEGDWPDELLFASWRMFEDIDRMLATIDTIDGQPRDDWPPWNLSPC